MGLFDDKIDEQEEKLIQKIGKDLNAAMAIFCHRLVDKHTAEDYREYSRPHQSTNEYLMGVYSQVDLSRSNNALTVLSSGDHVFNLLYHDVLNIDTFDCNRLTEYYALGFKLTAIKVLTFKQFEDLFADRDDYERSIEKYVISKMPFHYQLFWQHLLEKRQEIGFERPTVFDFCRDVGYDRSHHFDYSEARTRYNTLNAYRNPDGFEKVKENLKKANITFKVSDIREIPQKFGAYDFIELSNIIGVLMNWIEPELLISIIKNIYDNNLNDNGEMIFAYRYNSPTIERDEVYNGVNFGRKRALSIWPDSAGCLSKKGK
ncbi:MAG: hypothetical protein IJA94_05285 [Bacilli bacterium]|nr:hypothetical protein [Bacilli bacterium]